MKIKETINNPFSEGIFIILQQKLSWLSESDGKTLNVEYYLNNGEKSLSPVYLKMIALSQNPLNDLADIIILKFADKWKRLRDAFVEANYNPINNYDMVEEENVGSKIKTSGKSQNGTFGFNSESSVPTADNVAESITEGNIDDNHRKLTRSGNIGVTTSQQMIQSEIELRKYNFINQMIKDVNSVLTIYIYC